MFRQCSQLPALFLLAGVWLATVTPARVSLFLGPPCCFFQQSYIYIYVALMYPDVNHISVYTTFSPDSIKFRPFRSVFRGKWPDIGLPPHFATDPYGKVII